MKVIEEIFYGKIRPYEEISKSIPSFSEYSDKVKEKTEKIKKTFSEEQLLLFTEYNEKSDELHRLIETHSFVEGFKLGTKIIVEILGEKN